MQQGITRMCGYVLLVGAFALGCKHTAGLDPKSNGNMLVNGGFERGDLSHWGQEEAGSKRIVAVQSPVHSGSYAARLTVRPGDLVNKGHRAELVRFNVAEYGSEAIYSWKFMFDKNYVFDSRWQLIHQFHDWPDFRNGQTWDDLPGIAPPVFTRCIEDTCYVVTHTLTRGYKIPGKFKIKRGEWFELRYQAKWTTEEDGYIIVHYNGEPVTPFNGEDYKFFMPTLYNREGNSLKIGIYTDPAVEASKTVYVDDVEVVPIAFY